MVQIHNQLIAASQGSEVLVIGDTNVDKLKWDDPDPGMENMIEKLKSEITTRNFSQVVQGPTRFWNGARPSLRPVLCPENQEKS